LENGFVDYFVVVVELGARAAADVYLRL
jgi:hypothetical protein